MIVVCRVWDFTCPDNLAHSHLNSAVCGAGFVAREAEIRKRLKYYSLSAIHCTKPFTMETLGAMGEDMADFIHRLVRLITAVSGERRSTEFLLQRLNVAIRQGNAMYVIGTVGSPKE
jgi:hypothetical protein